MLGAGIGLPQLSLWNRKGRPALDMVFAQMGRTTLDPKITFSRTTNATLTNSAGLVSYAPHNLLTYSEQFDNATAWAQLGTLTRTANYGTAPNGTVTADRIVFGSASSTNQLFQGVTPIAGQTYTGSVWLRATSGSGRIKFGFFDGTIQTDYVNLTTEWTRVTSSKTLAGFASSRACWIYPDTTGDLTDIQVWGAQLELGSTATTYNPTTVKNLLGYTEHFDNAAWTKSNAFVQTNLLTYSQDFDNAAWSKGRLGVTANSGAAPDSTQTADLLVPNTVSGTHLITSAAVVTSAIAYTVSFYFKAAGYTKIGIREDAVTGAAVAVDLASGAILHSMGATTVVSSVGNGWWRVSLTYTAPAASQNYALYMLSPSYTSGAFFALSWVGDGTSGIYVWGAQLVQGTSAGDYKATYATAAAVGYSDIYGQPFAQKLVESASLSLHFARQDVTTNAAPYVISFYAKAAERSVAWATLDGASNVRWFDLAAGTTGGSGGSTAGTITDVGGGWYRCSYTFTRAAGSAACFIGVSNSTTIANYTGDGTSGIYIFGAQLSDSASVDPYVYNPVAAPTAQAYYGPRFDYDPVTLAPKGLLIEEQRTNLLTYSEQFDNAAWTKTNATITANSVVAPDGTTTADKIVSANASTGSMLRATGIASAQTIAFSLYAKAAEWRYVRVQLGASFSPQPAAWFDLQTGTLVSQIGTGASIQSAGNGWYRLTVVSTWVNTTDNTLYINPSNNSSSYTAGDGTSGIYTWGAQLEAGSQATSYIPTVASQVTRAADSASMIGNNFARWVNQSAGTWYAEFNGGLDSTQGGYGRVIGYGVNSTTPTSTLFLATSGVTTTLSIWTGGTAVQINIPGANYWNVIDKAASFYDMTTIGVTGKGLVPNSGLAATGTIGGISLGGNYLTQTNMLNGHIKRIAYYPRRLSNAELQGITS